MNFQNNHELERIELENNLKGRKGKRRAKTDYRNYGFAFGNYGNVIACMVIYLQNIDYDSN